ncbi:MAG: S8 family peptidase [Elainellaceae cyanobacterium]
MKTTPKISADQIDSISVKQFNSDKPSVDEVGVEVMSSALDGPDEAVQVIVKLDQRGLSQSSDRLKTFKAAYGVETLETTQSLGFELWALPSSRISALSDAAADDVLTADALDVLEYVQPNYSLSAEALQADIPAANTSAADITTANITTANTPTTDITPADTPDFSLLWGLENLGQTEGVIDADIDAPEAWEISTGSGVVVGVIDSGIDYTHPDLADSLWTNPGEIPGNNRDDDGNGYVDDYYGYDFVNDDGDPMDDNGHGTHVAGTIAASGSNQLGTIGVAPDAKVMALKFLDSDSQGSTFDAIQAIEYAMVMGADLTNNSWGGAGYSQALRDAIATSAYVGQTYIAAAGNVGSDNDIEPEYPASYDLDNVISVAASTPSDQLADFSNYGLTSVDVVAPGSSIYSTIPGGDYMARSGTSMATPHVTGIAALLLSAYPELSVDDLRAALLESVDPLPLTNTVASGGRVNAHQALLSASAQFEASALGEAGLVSDSGLASRDASGGPSAELAGDAAPLNTKTDALSTAVNPLSVNDDLSAAALTAADVAAANIATADIATADITAASLSSFPWDIQSLSNLELLQASSLDLIQAAAAGTLDPLSHDWLQDRLTAGLEAVLSENGLSTLSSAEF